MNIDLLVQLMEIPSPPGYEQRLQLAWLEHLKSLGEQTEIDAHGNAYVFLGAEAQTTIMIEAHADERGFQIRHIDEHGFLFVNPIGGVDPLLGPGLPVQVVTFQGQILSGVLGKPCFITLPAADHLKAIDSKAWYIDIGVSSHDEACQQIMIGDIAVYHHALWPLQNGRLAGRAMDDKIGMFALSQVIEQIATDEQRPKARVVAVSTVQEEAISRGAYTATLKTQPDWSITIDVAFATDYPGTKPEESGSVKLGHGPVIYRGPNFNPELFNIIRDAALGSGIMTQIIALPAAAGTNAEIIQLMRGGGVKTGMIGIPCRYVHTAAEVVDLHDVEQATTLLQRVISAIG